MTELITRKIDPNINKYFKILFFLTPIFLFIPIFSFEALKLLLVIAILILAMYELKIYIDNHRFIEFLQIDKVNFYHNLTLKYLKIYLAISFFAFITEYLLTIFTAKYLFQNAFFIFTLFIIIFFALCEVSIIETNLWKVIVKYGVLLLLVALIHSFTFLFSLLLIVQMLYLFIKFNCLFITDNNYNFIQLRKLINACSLFLIQIVIISTLSFSAFSFKNTLLSGISTSLLVQIFFINISCFILLLIILILRRTFLYKYNLGNIWPREFIILIVITTLLPIINTLSTILYLPFSLIYTIFIIIFLIIFSTLLSLLFIIDIIYLQKYANNNLLKKVSDNYDNWI